MGDPAAIFVFQDSPEISPLHAGYVYKTVVLPALTGAHEQIGDGQEGIAETGLHDRTEALVIDARNILVFFIELLTVNGV